MDPTATFAKFVEYIESEEYDEAEIAFKNLLEWYEKGGFEAEFPPCKISKEFLTNLAQFCYLDT